MADTNLWKARGRRYVRRLGKRYVLCIHPKMLER